MGIIFLAIVLAILVTFAFRFYAVVVSESVAAAADLAEDGR